MGMLYIDELPVVLLLDVHHMSYCDVRNPAFSIAPSINYPLSVAPWKNGMVL